MKKSEDSENPEKSKIGSIMAIISENNKFTKTISVLSLILIMFGLFAFIIIGLYRFDLIEIPIFIQNIFFKTDDNSAAMGKDDKNIYDYLRDNAQSENFDSVDFPDSVHAGNENDGYILEITVDNIKNIISNIKLPDNLYIETDAHYYTGDKIRFEKMSLWKKGGKYKYTLTVNSVLEESYINDAKNELIENFITGNRLKQAVVQTFSFDHVPHISNINYYLDLIESGEIVNQTISQNNDATKVRITYFIPQLDQRELIDISLDTGIVLYVECRIGQNNDLFYKSETTIKEFYYDNDGQTGAKTSIPDSLFVIR